MKITLSVIFVFIAICTLYYVYNEDKSTIVAYISVVGSIASIYAIIIAVMELKTVKQSAEATKKAVEQKMENVNQLLTFAEVEKHLQICSSINVSLKTNQYEAVALKLEELKKILLEIKNNRSISDKDTAKIQSLVMKLGSDITAVRDKWSKINDFDSTLLLTHVNEVSTCLQDISTKLKHKAI